MAAFFEIHDSILNGIAWNETRLSLNLRAVRLEWTEALGVGLGKTYYQEVRLDIDSAQMEVDSPNLPNWLLSGSYTAVKQIAHEEDIEKDLIPASLVRAEEIDLQLEGMNEDTHEYITIKTRGKSMSIVLLGEPEFLQDLQAST